MKTTIIRILTSLLPLKWLRKIYILYSGLVFRVKYGDPLFPRIITIEINSHCNRTCSYCPNVIYPQAPKLIKEEVIAKIISRLKEIDYCGTVDFIFFSEPTLNKHLAEYVRRVRQACPKAVTRICTNGDLLTKEKVQSLVDAGLHRIYAMRHNPTPEGWVENMQTLSAQFPGTFILMDIDEVERVEGLHDFNGLLEVKKHRGRTMVDGIARCQVHQHVAQITIDGDWDLCCVDYAKTHQFGSLMERGILEIWNDPKFASARALLRSGKPAFKVCQTCTCLVHREPTDRIRPDFVPRPA